MIEAGKVLQNRYRIEKQIGEGGMGAVYIATDERFSSTVAIKETFFSDESFGKAFEREARLLNNLRHSALPRVSDHFVDENGQFLVMEYIAGEDLSEMLEKRGSAFPLKDVLNWADQLLDALDYLHTQEMPVIHRDIKPQNLKLTPRGQIILLDFGLAKGNPTDAQHKTAAKSIFGYSRIYASLEQIQGTGTDPRSDLYSLAATIYHLLTGTQPADALTRAMTVLNNKPDNLKSAHQINQQVPESVSEVLNRAMSLNANHRPSSANAMRALLRESLNNQVFSDKKTVSDKQNPTEIYSQNTAVMFEAIPKPTEAKTDVLAKPISVPQRVDTEHETSVQTRLESANPIKVDIKNDEKPIAVVHSANASKSKGGIFAGVAIGGLLLVGGAVSAAYIAKPDLFGKTESVNTSNTEVTPIKNETNVQATDKSVMAGSSNITVSNTTSTEKTESVKKDSSVAVDAKVNAEVSTKNEETVETKNNSQKVPNPPNAPNSPKSKEVMIETDDAKIYKDVSIETNDTKITSDGKIIVKDTEAKPTPPQRRIPTAEEFKNMTPRQRQRMKQTFDKLPKEEQDRIRQEVENRKQTQVNQPARPPIKPYPPRP